jgi:hypothetical protein
LIVNLQQMIEVGNLSSEEIYIARELESDLTVLRASSNLSSYTAAVYVGLLHDAEPLTDGVLDASDLSALQGLVLPKGKLVLSGFYTGYVPPSCCRGQRLLFIFTLACKKVYAP